MKTLAAFFILTITSAVVFAQGPCNAVSINITATLDTFCSGDTVHLNAVAAGGGITSAIDQSQTVYTGGSSARNIPGYKVWQSFTAGLTGSLVRLDIGFFTLINGSGLLQIFSGSGTTGTLLWGQTVNVVCGGGNCLLPFNVAVPVVAGQVYTFQFMPGISMPDPYGIQVDVGNGYAAGDMALVDPSGYTLPGFDMVFNTYVSANGGFTYLWSNSTAGPGNTITSGDTYYISVTDSTGCSAVDSISVHENVLLLSLNTTHTTCGNNNGQVALDITGGTPPLLINWNNGLNNDTLRNLPAGTYSVTVSDGVGCSASGTAVVNPSGNAVTITSGNTVICSGDSVQVCAPAGFTSYLWNTGGTVSCVYAYTGGQYYVTITDASACTAESNRVVVTVNPSPSISISVSGDTLTAYGAVSYQWYLNGGILLNATSPFYVAAQPGSYTVAVTDSNGCSAISNPTVITGIHQLSANNRLNVFPNPSADGSWELLLDNNWMGANIEVFDAKGKQVFQSVATHSQLAINPPFIARGVYILRISSGKSSVTNKLVRL